MIIREYRLPIGRTVQMSFAESAAGYVDERLIGRLCGAWSWSHSITNAGPLVQWDGADVVEAGQIIRYGDPSYTQERLGVYLKRTRAGSAVICLISNPYALHTAATVKLPRRPIPVLKLRVLRCPTGLVWYQAGESGWESES